MNLSNLLCTDDKQVVFVSFNNTKNWSRVKSQIAAIQQQLLKNNAKTCALLTADGFDFVSSLLACTYLNVALLLPPNNSREVIDSLQADVYIGDFEDTLTIEATTVKIIDKKIDSNISIFTSGSTGRPKKITRKFSQLLLEVDELNRLWGKQLQSSLFIATVSSQHIYGMLFSILWPLKYGHRIWQKNIPFEESLEIIACQYDEIIMVSSPAFLKRLSLNNLTLRGKMLCFCSGGLLTQEQHKNAEQQLNSKINQVYGSSETGGIAHRALQTSWQFFSSVKHKVEKNSLYINSPFCYHPGWLDTNDSVTVCADGFELLGRNDRIVKIEEKRISLIQLERAIESNKLVEETHVIAITKQRQYIVAVIVLNLQGREKRHNIGEKRLKQEIKSSLRNKVEKLAIPKRIRFMAQIPVNSQGKTTRQQITAVFAI